MSKYQIKLPTEKGITMLEAVMAIAVLIIGILSLVEIFPLSLKIGKNAEQSTIATNLAQAKIEEIFYLDYDNIPIGTIESRIKMSDNPENPFYQYERETVAEYVDGNLNNSISETGLKKITTTVFWNSPILSTEKEVELNILISEK